MRQPRFSIKNTRISSASATPLYKCRDQSGTLIFKDTPCRTDETLEKNYGTSGPKPAITATGDEKSPGTDKSSRPETSANPRQGGNTLVGTGQTAPPPGPPEHGAEIVEHHVTSDASGNALITGKLHNRGKSIIQGIILKTTLSTKEGRSINIETPLDNLTVGETKDFSIQTGHPAQTLVNYLIMTYGYQQVR